MIAVVPAIVNAIAHATGLRFRELPVTAGESAGRAGAQRYKRAEATA